MNQLDFLLVMSRNLYPTPTFGSCEISCILPVNPQLLLTNFESILASSKALIYRKEVISSCVLTD